MHGIRMILVSAVLVIAATGFAPRAEAQSFHAEVTCCGTSGFIAQCFATPNEPQTASVSSSGEGFAEIPLGIAWGGCPAHLGGGPSVSASALATALPAYVSLGGAVATATCMGQGFGGGDKGMGRYRASIHVSDLVFSGPPGSAGGVVIVGLPIAIAATGSPVNVSLSTEPLQPWLLGAPQNPVGSWTSMPSVTLGATTAMDLTLEFIVLALAPHPSLEQAAVELQLGDPLLRTLFELPPGITVNAPSIHLIDNVFGGPPSSPWETLSGTGLAGTGGQTPLLAGTGALTPGSAGQFDLSNALGSTTSTFVIGIAALNAPFKGGIMVPDPLLMIFGLTTSPAGGISLPFTWPAGIPAGLAMYFQHWLVDAGGPLGYSASNGLKGTAQS